MKILLTTDTHFGHAAMYQKFGRPKNFEQRILKGLSKMSGDWDAVLHLGDFAWIDKKNWARRYFTAMSPSLEKAKHWLIRGNHDRDRSNKWYFDLGFDWVGDRMDLTIYGFDLVFTHEPLSLYELDAPFDHLLNIHGHWHNEKANIEYHKGFKYFKYWQKPFALEDRKYQPVPLSVLIEEHERYLRKMEKDDAE